VPSDPEDTHDHIDSRMRASSSSQALSDLITTQQRQSAQPKGTARKRKTKSSTMKKKTPAVSASSTDPQRALGENHHRAGAKRVDAGAKRLGASAGPVTTSHQAVVVKSSGVVKRSPVAEPQSHRSSLGMRQSISRPGVNKAGAASATAQSSASTNEARYDADRLITLLEHMNIMDL
jgi:hypothetical protein